MKILYLDLNYPDLIENYSLKSSKYGGGRCVPSALLHTLNNQGHTFDIWADRQCFEGIEYKYLSHCQEISEDNKKVLRNGYGLEAYLHPDKEPYDIVLHNFYGIKLNLGGLKTKDVIWLVGFGEHVNPLNERVILYNDYQNPRISNPNTKIYKARIGVPLPEFKEYQKEDYIFSCHRQSIYFGARWIMKMAHRHKLKYITAGPPDKDFPEMMSYVDNKYVTYLGIIPQEQKTELYSKAYCSTSLHFWNTPMNLSALESLSLGTPIISHPIGFWPSLIKNGKNGFFIDQEDEIGFMSAFNGCSLIKQKDCYDSMTHLSSDLMVQDYLQAFEQIVNE